MSRARRTDDELSPERVIWRVDGHDQRVDDLAVEIPRTTRLQVVTVSVERGGERIVLASRTLPAREVRFGVVS